MRGIRIGLSYRRPYHPARLAIARCLNPLSEAPLAERILVIRLGAVGDVVRTLPAVSALRAGYPAARITWLVEPPSARLVASQPWVDDVLVFPRDALEAQLRRGRLRALWRELRAVRGALRGRFDLVVDFHSILKSGLLARASAAPCRVAYARPYGRELAPLFATARARIAPRRISRFARNEALLEFLGVKAAPAADPLRVPPQELEAMARALGAGPAPVTIHPGTSPATPHKRWDAAGYGALARALARERIPTLVTVGPARGEHALAEAVVAASGGGARLAPPTPTLLALAALFAHCRLVVAGDTGPLHVASLVGTPVLQLLGPTDPVENAPYAATPSRMLRVGVGCSPCRRGCAAATCMRVIRPERVADAARALLAALPAR